METYEECYVCGNYTGRAGIADDSLYIEDVGPFCEDCYEERRLAKRYLAVVFDERREYAFFENDPEKFAAKVKRLHEEELVADVKNL